MSILTGDNPFYMAEKQGPCWKGYKKVPGKKDYEDGSCVKEDEESLEEKGLWDNIHAKRERIKNGSKERMRSPGEKGAPTDQAIKASQEEDTDLEEDKKGHFRDTEDGAGMTQKGVKAFRAKNPGSKLKTAVTKKPSEMDPDSKDAKRRKSFCARSKGWKGERGRAARRRWNC